MNRPLNLSAKLPREFFVAGTDTSVGKTYVSVQLIRQLVEEGKNVGVMKPVAAGCELLDGEWKNADALELMQASNLQQVYSEVNPYAFEQPVSPHIAARNSDISIDIELLAEVFQLIRSRSDAVLVEGAGGWLSPISQNKNMADLARKLDIPVVLVVGIKLGCLNHAQLTLASILDYQVPLAGWIANDMDSDVSLAEENIEYLCGQIDAPLLAHIARAK